VTNEEDIDAMSSYGDAVRSARLYRLSRPPKGVSWNVAEPKIDLI